jgi:hypothetical protein
MTRGKKIYVDTPRGDSLPRCALRGGKRGNLEKVGGYLQEIFLQGGIGLFTLFFISFRQRRLKLSHI